MRLPKFLQLLPDAPDKNSLPGASGQNQTSAPGGKARSAAQAPFNNERERGATLPRREQTSGVGGSQPSTENGRGEDPEHSFFNLRSQPDRPFHQHDFRTRAEFLRMPTAPRILISDHAYRRMCLIVETAPKEVGWLGTVERMPSGNFYIDEIFVPEQVVSGVETDPTTDGQFKVMNELAAMGEEGMAKIERLRFWGHSHVHMMTSPSSTDENTPLNYQRLGLPWFIRGIFNKFGRAEFTVYLFEEGHRFIDVPWVAVDALSGKPLKIEEPERHASGASTFRNSAPASSADGSERLQDQQRGLPDRGAASEASRRTGRFGWLSSRQEELPFVLPEKLVPSSDERRQVQGELAAKLTERSFGLFGRRYDTADGATPAGAATERRGNSGLTDGEGE
jgi:hypothetical protein